MTDKWDVWQAIIRKETELKLERQKMNEDLRNFDLKAKLMDLRIEAAFKMRDDYVATLQQKYPEFRPNVTKHTSKSFSASKSEIAIAEVIDKDLLQEWDDDHNIGKMTLQKLISSKARGTKNVESHFNVGDLKNETMTSELHKMQENIQEILITLKDFREIRSEPVVPNGYQVRTFGNQGRQEQEQAKTTISISRRQSFRDKEYSATEHISLPKAESEEVKNDHGAGRSFATHQEIRTANEGVIAKQQSPISSPKQSEIKPVPQGHQELTSYASPKFSKPRFNFVPSVKEDHTTKAPAEVRRQNDEKGTVSGAETSGTEAKILPKDQPTKVLSPRKNIEPENKEKEKRIQQIETSSDTSTPEAAKSSKVVKTYEALLGVVSGSKHKSLRSSSSDDSDDDIERNILAVGQSNTKTLDQEKNIRAISRSHETPSAISVPQKISREEKLDDDPDDFLAKLFPDKFAAPARSAEESATTKKSLVGDRKPKKSAFFVDDSDSDSIEMQLKKKSNDEFDFFK